MADDKEALNQQLLDIIRSMEAEGLVDSRFQLVRSLKEASGPFFFAELIPTFLTDSKNTIREMTLILQQTVMDYNSMEGFCMKIKGGSSCIGAQQIALACGDLHRAINDKCKERCVVAVDAIKHEYLKVHDKMGAVLQLERKIVSHD